MRLSVAALAACCVFAATRAAAEKSFPYKAYVTAKDVYVRSGPGEQYYPTEKLQPGAEVEVHRHDPGGWYAIRPLPNSFSWVSGQFLKPGQDGLAEVTADRVPARVGSRFSDIRDVVQVRLDRGEVVELKGTKQMAAGDGAAIWHKVSPPSGEFRWVLGKCVDPDYVPDGVRKTGADEGPGVRPGSGDVQAASPPDPTGLSVPRLPAASMRRLSAEQIQAELDDINTELSIMLAEEPTVWNCDELGRRAESLMAQAETALERGRARVLANRIAQAGGIKRRFEEVNSVKPDTEHRDWQWADAGRVQSEARRSRPADDRFDGTGRLERVEPSKVGAPRYALLDEKGDVSCYVSPAPGVNVQYYVGRQVGVSGQRGYIAEGNAQHIMARQVSALDSRLR